MKSNLVQFTFCLEVSAERSMRRLKSQCIEAALETAEALGSPCDRGDVSGVSVVDISPEPEPYPGDAPAIPTSRALSFTDSELATLTEAVAGLHLEAKCLAAGAGKDGNAELTLLFKADMKRFKTLNERLLAAK
tara:strand:+ start:243 stop:644 length:402 start_codon:yes stop_codon:yes gene_type:complete